MRLVIEVDGKIFVGADESEKETKSAIEFIETNFTSMEYLTLDLEKGGQAFIPKEVLSRATFKSVLEPTCEPVEEQLSVFANLLDEKLEEKTSWGRTILRQVIQETLEEVNDKG